MKKVKKKNKKKACDRNKNLECEPSLLDKNQQQPRQISPECALRKRNTNSNKAHALISLHFMNRQLSFPVKLT